VEDHRASYLPCSHRRRKGGFALRAKGGEGQSFSRSKKGRKLDEVASAVVNGFIISFCRGRVRGERGCYIGGRKRVDVTRARERKKSRAFETQRTRTIAAPLWSRKREEDPRTTEGGRGSCEKRAVSAG